VARYTGPDCKLCRRERMKLYLKGVKCESPKCPIERRPYPPGEHGRGRIKESEYLLQLREKQKARRIYGIMERQFRGYYATAAQKKGVTGEELLRLLETRLDNVVYRGGFANSRDQARQLVRHKHFQVNGRTVNIPSYRVRPGDVVQVREKSRGLIPVQEAVQLSEGRIIPPWLDVNQGDLSITVTDLPSREMIDTPVQEQLIVELYSK
jgi:small subunit ribosomal protein S4